jgi:hypothetical protein
MLDRKLGDISTDTTYSSANWHANEITTIVFSGTSGVFFLAALSCAFLSTH